MKYWLWLLCLCAAPVLAQEGVQVGKPSALRQLVPAEQLEGQARQQYREMLRQAASQNALAPDDHPQVRRLRAIAGRIIPHVARFNARAPGWQWEINLLGSKQINAFCMPGGKIAFYWGILSALKLNDDEVAMVMGHEIAHALREHAREQAAKNGLTSLFGNVLSMAASGSRYGDLANIAISTGEGLLNRKFSRDDETEADLIGMELAARAGFDPRAGISLWEKMGQASNGAPPQWLSTHPSNSSRIAGISQQLPVVMPLYERARRELR